MTSRREKPTPERVQAAMRLYRPTDSPAPGATVGGIHIPLGWAAAAWGSECRRKAGACRATNPRLADEWTSKGGGDRGGPGDFGMTAPGGILVRLRDADLVRLVSRWSRLSPEVREQVLTVLEANSRRPTAAPATTVIVRVACPSCNSLNLRRYCTRRRPGSTTRFFKCRNCGAGSKRVEIGAPAVPGAGTELVDSLSVDSYDPNDDRGD